MGYEAIMIPNNYNSIICKMITLNIIETRIYYSLLNILIKSFIQISHDISKNESLDYQKASLK